MKVRTDKEIILLELDTTKEIELTWEELKQLEKLIHVLRTIVDQGTIEQLLLTV